MELLNAKIDAILAAKADYIAKNKKMTVKSESNVNTLNYNLQTTLYKINTEQDKKLKNSKAFKKKEQMFNE